MHEVPETVSWDMCIWHFLGEIYPTGSPYSPRSPRPLGDHGFTVSALGLLGPSNQQQEAVFLWVPALRELVFLMKFRLNLTVSVSEPSTPGD